MENGGWMALASLLASGLLGVLTLLINKRYDKKTADLETQNGQQAQQIATLTSAHEACEENQALTLAQLGECEKKHETIEARVTHLEQLQGK